MRWKKLYIPCNSELGDRKNSRATRTRWAILVARLIRFILFTLQMKEEYKSLVEELNKLSEDFPATKERMIEIAKILLDLFYLII